MPYPKLGEVANAIPVGGNEELIAFRKTDEAKQLVTWVHAQYKACKAAKEQHVRQWYMNMAMYSGKQNAKIITTGPLDQQGKLANPLVKRGSEKQIINRIRPIIRTELARFLSQKPGASVMPASSEDEDLFAALAGEQVWESVSYRRKLHQHFSESAFWLSLTGNGFIKTYWDESVVDNDSGQQGDVVYGSVSPFNLFVPDLMCVQIEDQPYVLNLYTKSTDWLEYFFKDVLEGETLVPTTVGSNSLMEEAYAKNASNTNQAKPDSCIVYEAWIKPGGCKYMPEGGLVTLVDNIIVGFSPYGIPYKHGEYPFAHIKHIPTEQFYGESVIADISGLQLDYNDLRSQIAESRKKMAKPQFTAAKGAIVASKMTNEIGLVVEYRPGFQPPTPLNIAQLPNYVLQEQDRILTDIEDITGQHQVSKGNTPPGVTAATAISYLQEKDDSYLVHTYQSIEAAYEKIARHTLVLAVEFWDIQRLVKTVGEDGSFDTMMLMGSQLVNGTDIRIEPGSALPQSKAAKQAFIMDLMNMGHIPPDQGLELLEIGGATNILNQLQNDKRQAQRENIKLKRVTPEQIMEHQQKWDMRAQQGDPAVTDPTTGQPLAAPPIVGVNTYDNHDVHIDVHNRYRRSQAFELLSEEIKQTFETHVQMHKQAKMQEQMDEQQQGAMPMDPSMEGNPTMESPDAATESTEPTDTMAEAPGEMQDPMQDPTQGMM